MLAIGIDPGTATTGFGVVRLTEHGELLRVDHGIISTRSDKGMGERLVDLHRELAALIAAHRPDTAAVEKLFIRANVSTALWVGQARGVALLALAQAGVRVGEYAPREVKLAVCGYGGAGKRQMQAMVRALLRLEELPRPDDAADALAVAICHLHSQTVQARIEAIL